MVTKGPKHVASHTIKYDVFDVSCFIILILNLNTSGCLQSKLLRRTHQNGASGVFGVLSEFLRMRIISDTY